MNVSSRDRQLAHDFYHKHTTGLHRQWIEHGAACSTHAMEEIDADVISLAELIASVRVDGGLVALREAYSKVETDLRKAEARAENAERDLVFANEKTQALLATCSQAVAMLKETHHEALAVLIEQRVVVALMGVGQTKVERRADRLGEV